MDAKIVFINGRFLRQRVSGVQRYAGEVLAALDKLLSTNPNESGGLTFEVLAPLGTQAPPLRFVKFRCVGPFSGHVWEQVTLPWAARRGLLYSFSATGPLVKRRQAITIHDASVYAVPQAYSWRFRAWYKFLLRLLVRRVIRIVTVSRFSRSEISRYLRCDEAMVCLTVEGWQHLMRNEPDVTILSKHGLIRDRYVLAVSSHTVNKNFAQIVAAIRELGDPGFDVVIAGGRDKHVFGQDLATATSFMKVVGYVTDAELRALYEHAGVFVYPSFYEGFGLPAIEAMAAGCPIIVSNAASLPEICGEAAVYVSPYDPSALAAAINRVMSDLGERRRLSLEGRRQIGPYSWDAAARATLAYIKESIGSF